MAKALKRFLISASLHDWGEPHGQSEPTVLLTSEETHHLKNVLRIQEGSLCLLLDPEGNEFISRLERFRPDARCEAKPLAAVSHRERFLQLTVAQAIPQDRKMDDIVQKAAELGVSQLIPLITERTVVRIKRDQFEKVRHRWERIAAQTLKQSRLQHTPRIGEMTMFGKLSSEGSQYERVYLLHPSEEARPIRTLFAKAIPEPRTTERVLLMIGPEGGFSPREVELAKENGAQLIRLGPGILKTDTAFVAAVSFLKLIYE